jgi:hypothetical protein
MFRRLVLIVLLLAAAASPAWAQNTASYPGTPQEQKACRGDVERYCRGLTDASEVRACLVSHRDRINVRCRRVLQRHGY